MTIGVIPTLVEKGGRQSQYVDVEILCDNLDDLQAKGMIRGDYTQYIQVANNFDELRALLAEVKPTAE